jgi:hypothetical protein
MTDYVLQNEFMANCFLIRTSTPSDMGTLRLQLIGNNPARAFNSDVITNWRACICKTT